MAKPKEYDISDPAEIRRLHRELAGYMSVSLKHGTDEIGRLFAYRALLQLNKKALADAVLNNEAKQATNEMTAPGAT